MASVLYASEQAADYVATAVMGAGVVTVPDGVGIVAFPVFVAKNGDPCTRIGMVGVGGPLNYNGPDADGNFDEVRRDGARTVLDGYHPVEIWEGLADTTSDLRRMAEMVAAGHSTEPIDELHAAD